MNRAAPPPIPPPARNNLLAGWTAHYPEWIVVCVAIVSWFMIRDIRLSHDTFWQFWVARQMLGGEQLYSDIWEVNPPLWFWSAMPVQWLANLTGVAWQHLLTGLVLSLGLTATLLVAKLIPIANRHYRLALLVVVFLVAAVVPLGDIGQRDHLTLILSLPYAALIARRHAGIRAPTVLAIVAGIFAAYAFAMKHYFFVAPLALEIWLLFGLRKAWSPWRPEIMVLGMSALVYVAAILLLTPEFLTVAVPINLATYGGMQVELVSILLRPWVALWVVCATFIFIVRGRLGQFSDDAATSLHGAAIVLFGAYVLAYYLQHKVAYYHSIPATGAIVIALCLTTIRLHLASSPGFALGAALLVAPLSFNLTPDPDYTVPYAKPSVAMLATVPRGEVAFVAAQDPQVAWPAIEERKLVWPSRASAFWMLNEIVKGELNGKLSADLAGISAQIIASVSEDLRCNPPYLIIIPRDYAFRQHGRTFDLQEYLLRNHDLSAFLDSHYTQLAPPLYGHSYVRKGHVAGIRSNHCRVIH